MTREIVYERIRANDAAAVLGVSVRAVQSLALRGELPGAAKIGGLWTFDERVLRDWLKAISTPEDRPARSGPERPAGWRAGNDTPLQMRKSREACEQALNRLIKQK